MNFSGHYLPILSQSVCKVTAFLPNNLNDNKLLLSFLRYLTIIKERRRGRRRERKATAHTQPLPQPLPRREGSDMPASCMDYRGFGGSVGTCPVHVRTAGWPTHALFISSRFLPARVCALGPPEVARGLSPAPMFREFLCLLWTRKRDCPQKTQNIQLSRFNNFDSAKPRTARKQGHRRRRHVWLFRVRLSVRTSTGDVPTIRSPIRREVAGGLA